MDIFAKYRTLLLSLRSLLSLALAPVLGFLTTIVIIRYQPTNVVTAYFIIQAIVAITSEVSALGYTDYILRQVSSDNQRAPNYLRKFVLQLLTSGAAITMSIYVACSYAYTEIWSLHIFPIYVVDVVSLRIMTQYEYLNIALSKTSISDVTRVINAFGKLVGVLLYTPFSDATLPSLYASSLCVGLIFSLYILLTWHQNYGLAVREVEFFDINALPFAVGGLIRVLQQNSDRLILPAFLDNKAYAVYVIFSRGLQFANLPIMSVLRQLFPSFVRASVHGIGACRAFANKNTWYWMGAGAIGAASLLVLGFLAPRLTNINQPSIVVDTALLAVVPIFIAAMYWQFEILTAAGFQIIRVAVMTGQLFVQVVVQILLAQRFGIPGAVGGIIVGSLLGLIVAKVAIQILCKLELNRVG